MSIENLIKSFGGPSEMARSMGVTRQAVYYWRRRGALPAVRQMQAEIKLKEAK